MAEDLVDKIARAVLYEGYILYPYRPSTKNRQRWTFGGLYPERWTRGQVGSDASALQTECLVRGPGRLAVEVRFLHLTQRTIGAVTPGHELPPDGVPDYRPVEAMEVGGKLYQSWQEAEERVVKFSDVPLREITDVPRLERFDFPSRRRIESLRDPGANLVAVIVREQQSVAGLVELSATQVAGGLFKLTARVSNETAADGEPALDRDAALLRALVSTHVVLRVQDGAFISLLDPPEDLREAAAACRNIGAWPVLVGQEGETGTMLASPIILYDYPQIAPESPGDLFDSSEIDEILSLRILTLTEEERRQVFATDHRAAAVLERTEALAREQLSNLHGAMRSMRPLVSPEPAHD